jgi:GntR family transcriptional repressor for pyruvate dehydrogenase complex
MTSLLEPIDTSGREGASIEISRQLLDYLLSGRVQPGQRLPSERMLAEMLGVGRSVAREALKSLTLLGLLEVRPGDGTYVKRTDAAVLPQTIEWGLIIGTRHVLDLVEARRHLEVILAGLAAQQHDETAVRDLRSLLADAPRDRADAGLSPASEGAVLRRIGESANNEVLNAVVATVRSLLQVWLARLPRTPIRGAASVAALKAVVDAIEYSDVQAARTAIAEYVDTASEGLKAVLPDEPVETETRDTAADDSPWARGAVT